jgi:hypothetical protein
MKAWIFLILVFLLGGLYYLHFFKTPEQTVINKTENYQVHKVYFTREAVNDSVERKLKMGQYGNLFEIYTNICRDQEIISLLIFKGLEKGIPLNLLFALVQQESGFDPKALNRNESGSEDVGLMQLNTRRFSKQKKVALYDIKTNVDLGTSHLLDLKNQYGSWEEGIMRYNGWGDAAVKHLAVVLKRERDIDRLYNSY